MKRILLMAMTVVLAIGGTMAQTPSKMMKQASKLFGSYNLDPAANKDKLGEAYDLINQSLEDSVIASDTKAWLVKGKILNELSNEEVKRKILDPNYQIVNDANPLEAFEALQKALELAQKSYQTKDALKALMETENHLNNFGIYAFQDKEYPKAFMNFDAAAKVFEIQKKNEKAEDSRLNDPSVYSEHVFYTGVSAYYGEMPDKAKPYFLELFEAGTQEPLVYEALFTIDSESDPDQALKYLEAGREKFPNNTGLLFAEINYYVRAGELVKMIDKLEKALELEPDNVSIYTTLGSVYDNLSMKASEAENDSLTKEYFDKSLGYFNVALEKEPENFDAL